MKQLEIVIFEANQETVNNLADSFKPLAAITVTKVDRVLYARPPRILDAIFLMLPAAEKWGARPLPGKAQVLKTSAEDQHDGMPPHVVTGVVLRPSDPRGPLPETKMLISTALDAVRQFNLSNSGHEICKLGFWAVNLLNGVTPKQLSTIFSEVL